MPSFAQRTDSASGPHHSPQAEYMDPPMTVTYERPKPRHRGPPVWGERDKVVLLVDNKRFSICPLLLTREPNTMLGRYLYIPSSSGHMTYTYTHRMFGSAMDLRTNENGEYEVAKGVAAPLFKAILVSTHTRPSHTHTLTPHTHTPSHLTQEYYKSGIVTCPPSESLQELRESCDYLMIPFTEKTIRTTNLCKPPESSPTLLYCTVLWWVQNNHKNVDIGSKILKWVGDSFSCHNLKSVDP